jgi:hypothetical protein
LTVSRFDSDVGRNRWCRYDVTDDDDTIATIARIAGLACSTATATEPIRTGRPVTAKGAARLGAVRTALATLAATARSTSSPRTCITGAAEAAATATTTARVGNGNTCDVYGCSIPTSTANTGITRAGRCITCKRGTTTATTGTTEVEGRRSSSTSLALQFRTHAACALGVATATTGSTGQTARG